MSKKENTEVKKENTEVKKLSLKDRRDAFKKALVLTERIAFEDENTAVNAENSAVFLYDNVIMLTLTSKESNKATRIIEVWLHKQNTDVCISRKSFDSVSENVKKLNKYREYINAKKKSSKYVFTINHDCKDSALALVNEYIKNV